MGAPAPSVMLGPSDAVADRTFTHPDHVAGDRAVLCMLLRDFSGHLSDGPSVPGPIVRYLPHADRWHRRIVIPAPDALAEPATITVVGFFGRVRDVVDPVVERRIKELSDRLVDAVMHTPGVVGYSTHLLADERNYANLVLVASPDVIERWRTTAPHPAAAGEWSLRYYEHVRIYRGTIDTAQLDSDPAVRLSTVKYWDYRGDPVWHAERALA